MAITTKSSISVNAQRRCEVRIIMETSLPRRQG
jgi:hypothetical protein